MACGRFGKSVCWRGFLAAECDDVLVVVCLCFRLSCGDGL